MKKLLYILIAILLCACEHADVSPGGGSTANTKKICRGYGYEVVYSVRGDKVCNGYGYNVAYTIRGNQVCDGYGYSVAYTIRDDKVCNGYGYNVASTRLPIPSGKAYQR